MQIQADLLDAIVVRPKTTETTALGAAFFAGLATGYWESIDSLKQSWEIDAEFSPQPNAMSATIISNWEQKVKQILS